MNSWVAIYIYICVAGSVPLDMCVAVCVATAVCTAACVAVRIAACVAGSIDVCVAIDGCVDIDGCGAGCALSFCLLQCADVSSRGLRRPCPAVTVRIQGTRVIVGCLLFVIPILRSTMWITPRRARNSRLSGRVDWFS